MLVPLAWFVPTPSGIAFHEEKILEARARLTSHNILEIANLSRIHSPSRKRRQESLHNRKAFPH
jgi:hypothetical protein